MPAKAGIHLRFRRQAQENLDSGLRRNDERKSRLLVDEFRIPRLMAEGCLILELVAVHVQWLLQVTREKVHQ